MSRVRHIVKAVEEGSIARELDIEPGDELLSINGSSVKDVFDYHYLLNEEYVEILIRKAGGEEWELEIEKEYEEDLGIIFENEFMDDYRSCSNRCISVSLIRCRRVCERHCISRMMIPDCRFCRGIM